MGKRYKLGPRRGSFDCRPADDRYKEVRDRVLLRAEIVCSALSIRMPRFVVMHCSHIDGKRGYLNLDNTIFLDLGKLNTEEAYESTFAHEVSHLIVRKRVSKGRGSWLGDGYHGQTWKRVMLAMGQVVPKRYEDPDYDKKSED